VAPSGRGGIGGGVDGGGGSGRVAGTGVATGVPGSPVSLSIFSLIVSIRALRPFISSCVSRTADARCLALLDHIAYEPKFAAEDCLKLFCE